MLTLVGIVRTEQGSCPPTLAVDLRDANCGPEKPCNNSQLCCPTWQGGAMCVDPVTRRHFTTLGKSLWHIIIKFKEVGMLLNK